MNSLAHMDVHRANRHCSLSGVRGVSAGTTVDSLTSSDCVLLCEQVSTSGLFLGGLMGGLGTFVLIWTMAYDIVHIYG